MAVFGDTLRQARAYKGVTLKEAEQATRINRHHLAALEEENFGALPPLIYQRGIVRNYATYLDLDPSKLLAMFEEAHGSAGDAEVVAAVKPLDMPNHWAPNFAIIAFMVVMSAIVFAWLYSAYFAEPELTATTAPEYPTVTVGPSDALALPGSPEALVSPTAEPAPSPSPEPTETPKATETPEATDTPVPPTETPVPEAAVQPQSEAPVYQPPAEPTPVPQTGQFTVRIIAQTGITLTLTVDGNLWFSGIYLSPGQATEYITASSIVVETTSGSNTLVENLAISPTPFAMVTTPDYAIFSLP